MHIDVSIAFKLLLKMIQPDLICDVGSYDGSDSFHFRKICPKARILAFEANPTNYTLMLNNSQLQLARIEIHHKAAWKEETDLDFFIIDPDEDPKHWYPGASSLLTRDSVVNYKPARVHSIRLDNFLETQQLRPSIIALWIDVEGAAGRVRHQRQNSFHVDRG